MLIGYDFRRAARSAALCLGLCGAGLITPKAYAQDLTAVQASNNAGVLGVDLNPASLADSRFGLDILLFSAGLNIQGDYAALKRGELLNFNWAERADFRRLANDPAKVWREDLSPGRRNQYLNLSANLAPLGSVMVNLSPRAAVAFTSRMRVIAAITDAAPTSISLFLSDFQAAQSIGQPTTESGTLRAHHFYEYGLSYGRVVADRGRHFFKAGVRIKLLQGANAFAFDADNFSYTQINSTRIEVQPNSQFRYAFSRDFGFPTPIADNGDRIFRSVGHLGVGADLGVVYEFRPRAMEFTYDMDGERGLAYRDRAKYLLRVGLSLLDLGSLTYATEAVDATFRTTSVTRFGYSTLGSSGAATVHRAVQDTFGVGQNAGTFTMGLPTRLSLQIDGRLNDHFFVSAVMMQSLADARKATAMPSTYQITPRYESRVFDVMVPVTFNEFGQTAIGTFVRLGPVIVGSNSLWSSLVVKEFSNVSDLYFAVKIPVRYSRPRDKDNDKVSDEKDHCPTEKGTWEFQGCPDSDGDHVADRDDACPQDPGLPQFGGCPDTDLDGIPDKDDSCPRTPGPRANKGCPEGMIDLKKE